MEGCRGEVLVNLANRSKDEQLLGLHARGLLPIWKGRANNDYVQPMWWAQGHFLDYLNNLAFIQPSLKSLSYATFQRLRLLLLHYMVFKLNSSGPFVKTVEKSLHCTSKASCLFSFTIINIYYLIFFYSLPAQAPVYFTRKFVILVITLGHESDCVKWSIPLQPSVSC